VETTRPNLGRTATREPVEAFVERWQAAIDTGSADTFNHQFANDVLWGSPFGAVAVGYEQIHAIHERMFGAFAPVAGASRYHIEHVLTPTDDVCLAYVRRIRSFQQPASGDTGPGSFDELALLVLVERAGRWWLAAAQHVPDRRDVYAR
jgi:uncharacterized protein (TIGR02246 family)